MCMITSVKLLKGILQHESTPSRPLIVPPGEVKWEQRD